MDRTALIVVGLLALVALSPVAGAHAYLASSTPMPGGTVPEGTPVLALRFTEQLDPAEAEVSLVLSDGQAWPAQGEVPRGRPTEVRVTTDPLNEGVYKLAWRVLSVDGHVEEGHLRFAVGQAVVGPDPLDQASGQAPSLEDTAEGLARTLALAGVLAAIGLPLFVTEILRIDRVPDRVPGLLGLLLAGSLVGLGLRSWLLARSLEAPWGQTLSTRAGGLLVAQATLVLGVLAAVVVAWRRLPQDRRLPLVVAVIPASLVVVVSSMGGHGVIAFSSREAVAGHIAATVHVLVVGLWAGGVLGFLLLRSANGPGLAELLERFFPVGVISVLVVAATGLYQAYVHLPAVSDLWTSPYGRLLMAKSAGLLLVAAVGAVHQRVFRPGLSRGKPLAGRFHRVVGVELAVLLTIVGLAAVLAAAPLPEAPLDDGPPPAARFEAEAPTEGFWVRVSADEPVLVANGSYDLTIELQPRTSLDPEEANATLRLHPPGADDAGSSPPALRVGDGIWLVRDLLFDAPGVWGVEVELATSVGSQSVILDAPVQAR